MTGIWVGASIVAAAVVALSVLLSRRVLEARRRRAALDAYARREAAQARLVPSPRTRVS